MHPKSQTFLGCVFLWVKQKEKTDVIVQNTKINVITDMREHRLAYRETMRKYNLGKGGSAVTTIQRWERIFLEEGDEDLMKERRGRTCAASGTRKGRPPKLDERLREISLPKTSIFVWR